MSADLRFILAKEIFLKCQQDDWDLDSSENIIRNKIQAAFLFADDFLIYAQHGEFDSSSEEDDEEGE